MGDVLNPAVLLFLGMIAFSAGVVIGHRFGVTEGHEDMRRYKRDDSDEAGA